MQSVVYLKHGTQFSLVLVQLSLVKFLFTCCKFNIFATTFVMNKFVC